MESNDVLRKAKKPSPPVTNLPFRENSTLFPSSALFSFGSFLVLSADAEILLFSFYRQPYIQSTSFIKTYKDDNNKIV